MPGLKRAAAAMKSAEKDFFHHCQSVSGENCQTKQFASASSQLCAAERIVFRWPKRVD
jgi:hypothetical protein